MTNEITLCLTFKTYQHMSSCPSISETSPRSVNTHKYRIIVFTYLSPLPRGCARAGILMSFLTSHCIEIVSQRVVYQSDVYCRLMICHLFLLWS